MPTNNNSNIVTFANLGEVLSSSIMSAINTVVTIGGFVILFSVIISILNNSGLLNIASNILYPVFDMLNINTNFIKPLFSGLIELTNGLNMLTQIPSKNLSTIIVFSSFVLGFGGLSIILQVLSITSKANISIKPYIIGKFLQGIISAILTYIFIQIFPIFNLDLMPIFSQNVDKLSTMSFYPSIILLFAIAMIFTSFFLVQRKKV